MAERLIYDDAGTLKDVSVANPFPVQIGGSGGGGVVTVGGTAAAGAAATGNPVQVGGVYHSTAPTLTNGQANPIELDTSGNTQVNLNKLIAGENLTDKFLGVNMQPNISATNSWTRFQNLGANATLNVKSTAGALKSIYCINKNVAARYIQIHLTATTPSGGAVPHLSFMIPASGSVLISGDVLGENGYYCTTGIAFAFSTTEATYTAGAAGDQSTTIFYKA